MIYRLVNEARQRQQLLLNDPFLAERHAEKQPPGFIHEKIMVRLFSSVLSSIAMDQQRSPSSWSTPFDLSHVAKSSLFSPTKGTSSPIIPRLNYEWSPEKVQEWQHLLSTDDPPSSPLQYSLASTLQLMNARENPEYLRRAFEHVWELVRTSCPVHT